MWPKVLPNLPSFSQIGSWGPMSALFGLYGHTPHLLGQLGMAGNEHGGRSEEAARLQAILSELVSGLIFQRSVPFTLNV